MAPSPQEVSEKKDHYRMLGELQNPSAEFPLDPGTVGSGGKALMLEPIENLVIVGLPCQIIGTSERNLDVVPLNIEGVQKCQSEPPMKQKSLGSDDLLLKPEKKGWSGRSMKSKTTAMEAGETTGPDTAKQGDEGDEDSCVVKRSPLWRMVEAMKAFRSLPQSPHFRPLEKHQEDVREGLALGNMVAFAQIMEKSSRLGLEDPKRCFESLLEALGELGSHGFDVGALQSRVRELLSLKLIWEGLEQEAGRVGTLIREHRAREKTIAVEMDEIFGKMREMDRTLVRALGKKLDHECEMGVLADVAQDIQHVQLDLQARAAAFQG